MTLIKAAFRVLRRLVAWVLRIALLLLTLTYATPPVHDPEAVIGRLAGSALFDFITWEAGALLAKADETLYGVHPFMSDSERSTYAHAYMDDLARAQSLDAQIAARYSDSSLDDPASASASLRAERDALRADLAARQSLVEAILEGQIAAVLVAEGFGVGGQLLPPMSMRFTQVPNFLVVSPRDQIVFEYGFALNPLPPDAQAALETRIETAQDDVSALIVPLGGVALYPAMILERTSIPASLDTFAHEWLHHYLTAFPLGLQYEFGNETRIINETTAVQFGREVSQLVLARYYPDLVAYGETNKGLKPFVWSWIDDLLLRQPAFDYGVEMNRTRVRVDALLAAGDVEAAEAYMEQRRQIFVANGYIIRRLNQAFFAFYGGYQSGAPGAGGADPTGEAIARLRQRSSSLHEWIVTIRDITTREQLLTVLGST
jgi:hypothetical protein